MNEEELRKEVEDLRACVEVYRKAAILAQNELEERDTFIAILVKLTAGIEIPEGKPVVPKEIDRGRLKTVRQHHGNFLLSEEQARELRKDRANGDSNAVLMARYGISKHTIYAYMKRG